MALTIEPNRNFGLSSTSFAIIVSILYMLPINLNIGSFGGKPIDLAASNVLLILAIPYFFVNHTVSKFCLLGLMIPLFFIGVGLTSSLLNAGDLSIALSAFSFSLPFFHVGVGYVVGRPRLGYSFLNASHALSIVVVCLFFSDLAYGSFPRGCGYEGRWGGCLGSLEVYGFPNSSMGFIAVCSPLLALPFIRKSNLGWRLLSCVALVSLAIMVPLSLSRTALSVLIISMAFITTMAFGIFSIFLYFAAILFLILSFQWIISLGLFSGIVLRMRTAILQGDVSNGRLEIWRDAITVWFDSPIFGKAFIPFSTYSNHGTVHQQYLEVLYKTGLFGATVYFLYIFLVAYLAIRLIKSDKRKKTSDLGVFYAFCSCLFVANLFQPAISYQPMGNFVFFAMGVLLSRSAENSKVKNETDSSKPLHRRVRTS